MICVGLHRFPRGPFVASLPWQPPTLTAAWIGTGAPELEADGGGWVLWLNRLRGWSLGLRNLDFSARNAALLDVLEEEPIETRGEHVEARGDQ